MFTANNIYLINWKIVNIPQDNETDDIFPNSSNELVKFICCNPLGFNVRYIYRTPKAWPLFWANPIVLHIYKSYMCRRVTWCFDTIGNIITITLILCYHERVILTKRITIKYPKHWLHNYFNKFSTCLCDLKSYTVYLAGYWRFYVYFKERQTSALVNNKSLLDKN